jgi:RHS repeat-associated protein
VFGHVIRITDPAGNVTSYVYDPLGRQTSATDPDRGTLQTFYKASGLVDYTVDALGNRSTYTYDTIGRITERDDVGPQSPFRAIRLYWDRDSMGMLAGASLGKLVQVSDTQLTAALGEKYSYDSFGRLASSQRCVGATCMTVQQGYDPSGRIGSLTYPDGEVVGYGYDVMGRASSVGGYATATYNEVDQLKSLSYANAQTTTNTYDPARHWLNTVSVTLPTVRLGMRFFTPHQYDATYAHDLTGRISTLDLAYSTVATHLVYGYDDLGRLTSVTSDAAHTESFGYDTLGRMTSSSYLGNLYYTDALHVHAPTHTDSLDDRSYDRLGNLRTLSDHAGRNLMFSWSADGTLASIRNIATATTTAFIYDRTGERVGKTGGVPDFYFGPLVEQRNGVLVKYYTLAGRVVARNDGAVLYYTQDHRGSTRLVANASHGVVDTYDYTAFGRPIVKSESAPQDFEYDGSYDDESALTYMHARYYDGELSHFASADTIVPNLYRPQSLHRYSYVEQDPVNHSDPSGHQKMQVEWKNYIDQQETNAQMRSSGCNQLDAGFSMQCDVLWTELDRYPAQMRDDTLQYLMAESAAHRAWVATNALQAAMGPSILVLPDLPPASDPDEWAQYPKTEEATLQTSAAADAVSYNGVLFCAEGVPESRPQTLLGAAKKLWADLKLIPRDEFVFAGFEGEAKQPLPKGFTLGETAEMMYIFGSSNTHAIYDGVICAAGIGAELETARGDFGAGIYKAYEEIDNSDGSSESRWGIFVEGTFEGAYGGGYQFGNEMGIYGGVRAGPLFVGGGMSLESLNWTPRVFWTIHSAIWDYITH